MNDITAVRALSALIRTDFFYFVWKCVNTVSPGTPFLPNWHIRAVVYALMRVHKGEVTRLLINQPPRSLKSICVSVAFVAWCLGHDPKLRFIVASYSNELAADLHRQFRMVLALQTTAMWGADRKAWHALRSSLHHAESCYSVSTISS